MMFLKGFLFGLALQLSVGPVFFAVVQTAITKGFHEGVKMALGVTLVDAAYIVASILGMSYVLGIPLIRSAVLWGGAALLIYFGWSTLKSSGDVAARKEGTSQNSFLYGITLTLTNPLTILFWSGVFGSLLASQTVVGQSNLFFYSLGCVTATFLFLCFVSAGGTYISKWFQPQTVKRLNVIVGCFLILFALILIVNQA